jgi:hypothetical protein
MFKKERSIVLGLFFICLFHQLTIANPLIKKKHKKNVWEYQAKDSCLKKNTLGLNFGLYNFIGGIPSIGERYHSYNLFYLRKLSRVIDLGGSLFYGMQKDGLRSDYQFHTNVYGLGFISRINARIRKATLFFEPSVYYGQFREVRWFNGVAVYDNFISGSLIVNPSVGIGISISPRSSLEFKAQSSFYISSKFNNNNIVQSYITLSPSIGYTFKF